MELKDRFNELVNIMIHVFEILYYSETPEKELINNSLDMLDKTKELLEG